MPCAAIAVQRILCELQHYVLFRSSMPKYSRFLAVGLLVFASAAEAARKKQRSQVKKQSQSGALASKQDGSEEFYPAKGTCKVQRLQDICECNQWSLGAWGYKCSGCKDKFKWGYGCSLACPTQCSRGCDFSGNCISDPNAPIVPETCKRNSRIADKTDTSVTTNERNECQACDGPFYGLMCEHKCPDKCAKTAEGTCGRGGECYECEEGYHGETCSEKCSPGCPTCVMVDGLVAADEAGEFLPQGFCNVECTTDKHGDTCVEVHLRVFFIGCHCCTFLFNTRQQFLALSFYESLHTVCVATISHFHAALSFYTAM